MATSTNKSIREYVNENFLITFRYIKNHKVLIALIIFIYILFMCALCHVISQMNHITNLNEDKKV